MGAVKQRSRGEKRLGGASTLLLAFATVLDPADGQTSKPVQIRLGTTTTSGPGQIWLMKATGSHARSGTGLQTEDASVRGVDVRFKAFQAGQTRRRLCHRGQAVQAAIKGVPLVITAASRKTTTPYELGARLALLDAGLNPDRDVRWAVVLSSPWAMLWAMARSIRPESPAVLRQQVARGGIRILFTANDARPAVRSLMVI